MNKETIGAPSMKSMGSAFGDWGVGLAGGGIYTLARAFLGTGLFGSVLAPIAAGSFLKGPRGTVISTIAGFQAAGDLLGGLLGGLFSGGGSSNDEVM